MPFPITVMDTSIDSDRFETLDVTTTKQTSAQAITGARVIIVSTVDVYVDIGTDPDCDTSRALVPARTEMMFGIHKPYEDRVSVKSVTDNGVVTIYHV